MDTEEAALRAKIQAMKNLLQVKKQQQNSTAAAIPPSSYSSSSSNGYYQQRRVTPPPYYAHRAPHALQNHSNSYNRVYNSTAAKPANRSWNRLSNSNTGSSSGTSSVPYLGVNKVWRKADEVGTGTDSSLNSSGGAITTTGAPRVQSPAQKKEFLGATTSNKSWKRPLKVASSSHGSLRSLLAKRARGRMQLQVLKLEDGEYAKANGGFSLIRAGVKKQPTAALPSVPRVTRPTPKLSNAVSIGGVKYIATKRGNSLKRLTVDEVNKSVAAAKQNSLGIMTKGVPTSATSRAQAAVQRARIARLKKQGVQVRTEYCYCNKKNDCKFIHDSRRVAICRKFLRDECTDPNCLLSHKHDQNKMPVCTLFLRGACTREDCKYRHVKVSRSAQVCEAFLKGYCSAGASCRLKHELPPKKKSTVAPPSTAKGKFASCPPEEKQGVSCSTSSNAAEQENVSPVAVPETANGASAAATRTSSSSTESGLSLRPNIRFRPKNASGFPSLFSSSTRNAASSMMDTLAFIAESRGARGICAYLQENSKHAAELLDALATPVLLEPTSHSRSRAVSPSQPLGKDTGVQLEQVASIKAQREIWSALVRMSGGPLAQRCRRLALRFLQFADKERVHAADPVCRSLAQAIVVNMDSNNSNSSSRKADFEDDEKLAKTKRDAEFKEALRQLTFSRMSAPAPSNGSDLATLSQLKLLLKFTRPNGSNASSIEQPQHLLKIAEPPTPQPVVPPPSSEASDAPPLKKHRGLVQNNQEEPERHVDLEGNNALSHDDVPVAATLSAEVEDKAAKLAKQLAQLATPEAQLQRATMDEVAASTVQLIQTTINATNTTHVANEPLFARLCTKLQLVNTSDEALFQITTALVESNWSSRYAAVFLGTSVYPKIVAASSVISRVLLQTALLFSPRYATALVDSLLLPLLTTKGIASAQGEAITRILRNGIPVEHLDGFLRKSFQYHETTATSATAATSAGEDDSEHFFTNEAALMVLQNVLTMKATLSDTTIERFIECCEAAQEKNGAELQKSLKFATLVFTMISKYADQCVAHVDALEGIGKRLTSLMAKSTMRSIQKLKATAASR
uniref:C3H1-type domain-containing protein n=1 Tax=Globisporangium ultimum (strain ATCC 200006 / CBS 805.95 / DAOM BR144) TaxID=431595 RepID=K3X8M2_GLOUD